MLFTVRCDKLQTQTLASRFINSQRAEHILKHPARTPCVTCPKRFIKEPRIRLVQHLVERAPHLRCNEVAPCLSLRKERDPFPIWMRERPARIEEHGTRAAQ